MLLAGLYCTLGCAASLCCGLWYCTLGCAASLCCGLWYCTLGCLWETGALPEPESPDLLLNEEMQSQYYNCSGPCSPIYVHYITTQYYTAHTHTYLHHHNATTAAPTPRASRMRGMSTPAATAPPLTPPPSWPPDSIHHKEEHTCQYALTVLHCERAIIVTEVVHAPDLMQIWWAVFLWPHEPSFQQAFMKLMGL